MERLPVCLFAKPPAPGRVKTRIGRVVGHAHAAALADALLRDAWDAVVACPWARPILATTDVHADFGLGDVEAWDQGQGDLGAKVERILRRGVDEAGVCFAVGADTAGLSAARLTAARDALRRAPSVLGPSDDGGFWLLGLTACPAGLLSGLPWSAPDTCEATAARLRERLGEVAFVASGFDVDEVGDLQRLVASAEAGELSEGRASTLARTLLEDQKPSSPGASPSSQG